MNDVTAQVSVTYIRSSGWPYANELAGARRWRLTGRGQTD